MILTALNSQITGIKRNNNGSPQGNQMNRENAQNQAIINHGLLRVYFAGSITPVVFNPPEVTKLNKPLVTPDMINDALKKLPEDLRAKLVDPDNPANPSPYVAAFNPGAITDGKGGAYLLIRGFRGDYKWPPDIEKSFASDLWYAHSPDGMSIDEDSLKPVILPDEKFKWGYEDPRITKMKDENNEDIYRIICTGFDGTDTEDGKYDGKNENMAIRMICFETKDFKIFKDVGLIGPIPEDTDDLVMKGNVLGDKDAFFLPEKVNRKLVLFHRVMPDIQGLRVKNIKKLQKRDFWKEQLKPENLEKSILMKHRPNTWENKLGGGPPPVKVKVDGQDYMVMIYHGSGIDKEYEDTSNIYRGGVALLDPKDPLKVIARCPEPILVPDRDYEIDGPVHNVVFPQGIIEKGDDFLIYYGCADKNVGVAKVNIKELVNYTKQFNAEWWKKNTDYEIKGNPKK